MGLASITPDDMPTPVHSQGIGWRLSAIKTSAHRITGREPGEIPVNSGRKKWSRIADAESTERLAVDVGGDFPG
jgi:hypothetical protein